MEIHVFFFTFGEYSLEIFNCEEYESEVLLINYFIQNVQLL